MRILVDGYFLGKPYGFGRFILELCRALGAGPRGAAIVVAVPDRAELRALPSFPGIAWHFVRDANFVVWEQWTIPRLARRLRCDVIHFPYNTRALIVGRARTVTTVHDVIFLSEKVPLRRFKAWFVSAYAKRVFRWATPRSDVVVSVSDTTNRALARRGIPATTVFNTVDGFLALRPVGREAPARRYVFHRGGYAPHRNTARVVQAFARLRERCPDIELWIAGAPDGARWWGTGADDAIRYLPRLSDADLAACYARSACVVAASLQEGFGLPIIEAFGFGAPVITSDRDPMREIAGGAALLVDPADTAALEAAMRAVLTDPRFAGTLVRKGRDRAKAFASGTVAEAMQALYRRCLEGRGARG